MKKLALTTAIAAIVAPITFSNVAHADTIFGVYAGIGSWKSDYSGDAGDPSISAKELGFDEEKNNFYYIALEHPVPLVPNIKLQQTDITSKQTAFISKSFGIDNTNFIKGTNVTTDLDLSYTDATLYYEILDNWLNLDVGLTARKFSGHLDAKSVLQSESVDVDQTIPLLYGKAQFDLPFSGFSAGVELNYANYKDDSLTDYSAKIGYLFDSAFDVGVEVGYRALTLNIEDDDVDTDLELKGPYAAAIFHF